MGTKTHEAMSDAEVRRTFDEIAHEMGCISCIAEARVTGDSPQGINIAERYMRSGLPGFNLLNGQIPETD